MKKLQLSLLASAVLLSTASYAEQPSAKDLVGKFYGGLHYTVTNLDDERLEDLGIDNVEFESSEGAGLEVGYRYSEKTEFRLSYTAIDINFENTAEDDDGGALALDVLYFPTAKNFYLLAGVNNINLFEANVSADLGLGYRHHFSEKLAAYGEAKVHYELNDFNFDNTLQVGLIYFFGAKAKPVPEQDYTTPVVEEVVEPVVVAPIDSDNDGVVDSVDNCLDTPVNDNVDVNGCTIFTEETLTQRLSVNFGNNSTEVPASADSELAQTAAFLQQYPQTSMTINGYTSIQGKASYNLSLSQKRADAVVAKLVNDYGIDASRLSAIGYGETNLLNTENTKAAHQENRRIEATVSIIEVIRSVK